LKVSRQLPEERGLDGFHPCPLRPPKEGRGKDWLQRGQGLPQIDRQCQCRAHNALIVEGARVADARTLEKLLRHLQEVAPTEVP
jgi:hypothetical protein